MSTYSYSFLQTEFIVNKFSLPLSFTRHPPPLLPLHKCLLSFVSSGWWQLNLSRSCSVVSIKIVSVSSKPFVFPGDSLRRHLGRLLAELAHGTSGVGCVWARWWLSSASAGCWHPAGTRRIGRSTTRCWCKGRFSRSFRVGTTPLRSRAALKGHPPL